MNTTLDPGALKDLINASLFAWGVPIAFLLQIVKNLWANAVVGEIPRWADAALAVAAALTAVFLVSAWHRYLPPDTVPSMMTDFRVQSFVLWLSAVASNFVLKSVYGSGRPPATADELRAYVSKADPVVVEKAGVSVAAMNPQPAPRSGAPLAILGGLLVALVIAAAAPARAEAADAAAPPWVSWHRLAGGVALQGVVYSNGAAAEHANPVGVFAPKAYLSYSVLDEVSAHVSWQLGVGAARVNELHYGGAVRLLKEDPVRISAGVDGVHYSGTLAGALGPVDVTEYSLRFSRVLKRSGGGASRAGFQLQPAYVPEHAGLGRFVYRFALNLPVFGGEAVTP